MSLHGADETMWMGPGMRTPGTPWLHTVISFVSMWTAMMAVMMLPSLIPTFRRYHRALEATRAQRVVRQTLVFGLGYLAVWAALGPIVFAMLAVLAAGAAQFPMVVRAAPLATGFVVIAAGAVQVSAWKAHHLACCGTVSSPDRSTQVHALRAWSDGVRLGVHCALSCAGPTATLLVAGVMELHVMVVIALAITAERVMPIGARIARGTGVFAVATGVFLVVRAIGVA